MDGVTAIANILRMEGVEFVACVPYQPLLEAAAIAGIRPMIFRQEVTGIHMVDGYSRATNGQKIGVFMMQNGPGAENGFGGVAQAYSRVCSHPAAARRHGPRQARRPSQLLPHPQLRDHYQVVRGIQHGRAHPVHDAPRFHQAPQRTPRPRPAGNPGRRRHRRTARGAFSTTSRPAPSNSRLTRPDVSRAAAALLAAERPVIQAGQGVLYAEATDELVELAEFLQAPVMTTLPGKSAFPENHPLAIGAGGPSTTAMVNKYLHGADTVFGVGASLTKSFFAVPIEDNKTFIHLTNDEDAIGREYKCHYPMLGDAKLVLRQLLDALKDIAGAPRPVNHALHADIRSVKEAWLSQWMPRLTSNEKPMNPYRVVWDLMHTVDLDNTIVTHESGSAREYMSPFWEARAPRSFIGWGKSTQLGYSLGLAMGAKLAFPDKQVINVMGDMAFSTVGLDIETAVRCDIPILTVVNNNSYMSIYDDSRFPTAIQKYQVKSLGGQFAEVAAAMGAYAEKITEPEEIVPAINRAIAANAAGEPAVLEFITRDEGNFSKF